MKVALYTDNWYPTVGGVQTHISSLISGMADVDFTVYASSERGVPDEEAFAENARVTRIGPAGIVPRRGHRALFPQRVLAAELRHRNKVKAIEKSDADVAHVHGPALGADILRADGLLGWDSLSKSISFALMKKPKLLTMHGLFSPYTDTKVYAEFERTLTSQFDSIICVDRSIHARVREIAPSSSSHYIPNAVDTSLFKCTPNAHDVHLKIAYVGRPDPLRGFDTVSELAKDIPDGVELTLVLASEQGDAPTFPRAVRIRWDLDAAGVRDEIGRANLVLNPIRIPVISRVTMEAMACGRAVVAVDREDNEPIRHGETGLLFDGTLSGLASLLAEVRSGRHDLDQIGKNARAAVEREYSYGAVMPRIRDIYKRAALG